MSELGDRLRRHVEGSAPDIGIDEITTSRQHNRFPGRRLAMAAVVVLLAGTAVVIALRLGDESDAEVGDGEPADSVGSTDPWDWLDFGTEGPTPAVPDGWQTLEYGSLRFSVPGEWTSPFVETCVGDAPGVVLVGESTGSCNPPDDLPPSVVRIGSADEFSATGPESERVRGTVTDSGRVRVLQHGPSADVEGWRRVSYGGIEFSVPQSWPVVDLPGTYRVEGNTTSSGADPGACGRAWFASGEVVLGVARLAPRCMRSGTNDLRPGLGVWARELDPNVDLVSTTLATGSVDGMTVEIIDMDAGEIADPLHVLFTRDDRRTLLSLGVGFDTPTARAILRSITAGPDDQADDATTTARLDEVARSSSIGRSPLWDLAAGSDGAVWAAVGGTGILRYDDMMTESSALGDLDAPGWFGREQVEADAGGTLYAIAAMAGPDVDGHGEAELVPVLTRVAASGEVQLVRSFENATVGGVFEIAGSEAIVAFGRHVAVVDLDTGALRAEVELDAGAMSMAVADDLIWVSTTSRAILALDRNTLETRDRREGSGDTKQLVSIGDDVWGIVDGDVVAVSESGLAVPESTTAFLGQNASDGRLWLVTRDALIVVDADSGIEIARAEFGSGRYPGVLEVNGETAWIEDGSTREIVRYELTS